MKNKKIVNFAIIAHIDHGKSTLADRLLEITNTLSKRELKEQHLDSMELEKERGITIKLNAVQIKYKDYHLNLIDTPGHVDFTYEVSRSLAACEGAVLLIDATQGIEAQTIANVYLAFQNNLKLIVAINKIDLPLANTEKIKEDVEKVLGIKKETILEISAKTGQNVQKLLDKIVEEFPKPLDDNDNKPLKALVFDSYFCPFRGVILFVRIFEGKIFEGDTFIFMSSKKEFKVTEIGIKNPEEIRIKKLFSGEVGWIAASIRDAKDISIGDTITLKENGANQPLPGYKKLKPVVFAGFYPVDGRQYNQLKEALDKISLSDSSIIYSKESSTALGFGFRLGFLGILHMEIIKERIEREFLIEIISTTPTVEYKVIFTNGNSKVISNPSFFPETQFIKETYEPYVRASIVIPNKYIGNIMELCKLKRAIFKEHLVLPNENTKLVYEMPLSEIIFDFFGKLKSVSKGYAIFDYEIKEYKKEDLVKVEIMLNKKKVEAFSFIVERSQAYSRAREIAIKLKKYIPKHNFEIPIQATINNKIIARETIKAFRKDVTEKLYGGDRTRRDKLLKKQKKGKLRAKQFGVVNIPKETFTNILKTEQN